MPEAERAAALGNLDRERLGAEIDDGNWAQWYDHYHRIVLTRRNKWSIQAYVQHGLSFNLETAAVYVLLSTPLVPGVRHWWCILPASMWVLILVAQEYEGIRRVKDKWTTLSEQVTYLSEEENGKESERPDER